MMDDNDSIITDLSVLGTPSSFRDLPKSAENSIYREDLTAGSSDAVIKALQTLQQKIRKLELERKQAEKEFGNYEKEADQFKEDMKYDLSASPLVRLVPTSSSTPEHSVPPPSQPTREPPEHYAPAHCAPPPAQPTLSTVPTALKPSSQPVFSRAPELIPDNSSCDPPPPPETRKVYYPSSSQPYATYVRPPRELKDEVKESGALRDSRVNVLEKQLEYMRRLVHNAERERVKATEKMCSIESEKENKLGKITMEELEKQNAKILELEKECTKLSTAHFEAQNKISELEGKLLSEKENQAKLLQQTEELARVTEENKNMMLSFTPSLPPSPPPPQKKKKRKRPSSSGSSMATSSPADWKAVPFVCGRSANPSHSLSANVQQMLSALKQENPSLCARITTQKRKSQPAKDIKQVISGLEEDLGSLTFECQKLRRQLPSSNSKKKLEAQLETKVEEMEKKSEQIKKLKSVLKRTEKSRGVVVTSAAPATRPFSNLSNKEVQISVRGKSTRELLNKVKSIRDVLTNKDVQWV